MLDGPAKSTVDCTAENSAFTQLCIVLILIVLELFLVNELATPLPQAGGLQNNAPYQEEDIKSQVNSTAPCNTNYVVLCMQP